MNNSADMTDIESIQFFDSIVAIRKRKQLARYQVMVPPSDELFPVPAKNL